MIPRSLYLKSLKKHICCYLRCFKATSFALLAMNRKQSTNVLDTENGLCGNKVEKL